jgi:hypothetical protein
VTGPDPIDGHVTALAAALRGPARVKARILTEVHDGLADAARALDADPDTGPDTDPRAAAVRDFGPVEEVAPAFQRELSIAQARRTAGVVALAAPGLGACWFLVTLHGRGLPHAVGLLAVHLGGVTAATALLAAAALAATGALARRLPTPHRLPIVVAWTGTTASVALAVSALTLTAAAALAGNWTLSVLIGALTIAFHARVAASARACRMSARACRTYARA